MRVAHLTSLHPADDVRVFHKECRTLALSGYEVHLVAPEAWDETREGVRIHGFEPPGGWRPLRIFRRLRRVYRVAREIRADVYHFHEPELVPVALLLRRHGPRAVYDVHEDHVSTQAYEPHKPGKRLGFRLLEALARRWCDGFVVATPAIGRLFPPGRSIELRNYPLREEIAEPREHRNGADVVYVGGIITPVRGLREMVEAAERLRNPRARLILIGSFDSADVEQEARALSGWRRVEHLGRLERRELMDRLAAASVGLVVLHPERGFKKSLPIKLFEYMSAGLPVVASDFPYWRELLDPIGCATFVDPLDPGRIAAAVDDLLADEEHAREMGARGAAAVRERLNWEREAPKLLALYKRLGVSAAATKD